MSLPENDPAQLHSSPLVSPTRREFVRYSSGIAAGALFLNPMFYGATEPSPKKIRMGVVGGGFGAAFSWHQHPNCSVVAVSDLREDRRKILRDRYKCDNVYNSLTELLTDKNVDAVSIFTEGPNHVKHVEESMRAGKHVITAVPACWGTLEEAERLRKIVEETGLTYMMAETSYWEDYMISARQFYKAGEFGDISYCESEYIHDGLELLFHDAQGNKTWRYGATPMHYPTHCTAHLIGLTGERLTSVICSGYGDDNPILKDNVYNNPYWNESAMFTTERGNTFRARVWWKAPAPDGVRAEWYGSKMSFFSQRANEGKPQIYRRSKEVAKDSAGFSFQKATFEEYDQPDWYKSDLLPDSLHEDTGHRGSHPFIIKEFVDSLVEGRRPAVDVYEALAYTVPGIVAHQSALKDGECLKIPSFDREKRA